MIVETSSIPTLETSKITLRKIPDPGSTMREWYNIKSLPIFGTFGHYAGKSLPVFFEQMFRRNISLLCGKITPGFRNICKKTREMFSRVLEKCSDIAKNQGNIFPGFREMFRYSIKLGSDFMLYHSRIVEPGSGFFLRVILLVSNVGMIFVPFSEKGTCKGQPTEN